jgi:hypothetical protein
MAHDEWPAPLAENPSHPRDIAPPWSEHVQGVTNARGQWFISQTDRLWRFPLDLDLAEAGVDAPGVRSGGIPEAGIEHFGDCDYHDGLLYVAMEGTDPARTGTFDRDLGFVASAPVDHQGTSHPWCAVSPADGLLYSSTFDTDRLCVYRRSLDVDESGRVTGLELEHVRDVPLRGEGGEPLSLQRVQGGAFSPRNHLYLACDTRNGGLRGFDVTTGRCQMHVEIRFESGWPEQEVIEGLTVLDLDDGRVPRMSGQVHVLVFDAEHQRDDYVWLRHFAARTATDRYRV